MVAILLLNWNGYKDTIDCINSLLKMSYKDFFVVVGDNGSSDNSIDLIKEWCNKNKIDSHHYSLGEKCNNDINSRSIHLYDMKQNHGFSIGNNYMIKFVKDINPDYYFLLNNDTVVEPDFLQKLVDYSLIYPEYKILSPQIRYYSNKDIIWNCGGSIYWGFRKYHYALENYNKIKEKDLIECSYITGCAMLFKNNILNNDGCLFTEKFFFGEEDFDLGLRMKEKGMKMACIIPSLIYHKVSVSTKSVASEKKSFIHFLNRIIDVRDHFSVLSFSLWEFFFLLYMLQGLLRENTSIKRCFHLINLVFSESKKKNDVLKDYFEMVWNGKILN